MAGEVKNFDSPDETRPFEGKGKADVLNIGGQVVGKGVFEPGWKWSENVKPIAQTDSCQISHLGYCISGAMTVHMDDGNTLEIGPGDVFAIPPGHDAEVTGSEPCVSLDFGEFGDYAKRTQLVNHTVTGAAGLSEQAMSEENVEVVRRAFQYLASGRGGSEVLASFDPNVVMKPVETGATYGVIAIRDNFERWQSTFDELEVTVEEIIDAGDRVVHSAHWRGRGRGSGVEVDARYSEVYTLRDGKIIRVDEYTERADALEAAGLSEQAMSQENVEIVRAQVEAFQRGDSSDALSYIDPNLVWDASRIGSLDTRVAYGLKEFGETMRRYIGAFEDFELQRPTDLGSGAVLALGTGKKRRGKGGHVRVRQSFAALYTVIDGKIARITFFPSEEEALEAAGLSEQAMSGENVDVMRIAMEAFNRRDGTGLDALLANDAEIVPVRSALEGTVYRGTDAGSQYCTAVEQTWDDLRWEVEEMRVGAGWVLALGRIRGQGHDTGVAIDSKAGWLAHFRDGLITRFQTYADRAKALEAAGLSEQAISQENVELVRDGLARFREIRQPRFENLAADFVWDMRSFHGWTGKAEFHGVDGIGEFMAEWTAAYSEWTFDVEDVIDADESRVVATVLQRGRPKGSDAWVDLRVAFLYIVKDGLVRRIEAYASPEQALEAAGLSE